MPDGTVVAFPDDMSSDQIKSIIATKFPEAASKVDPATNQPTGVPAFDPGVAGYDPKTGEVTPQYGMAGSAAMGAADIGGLGLADEGAAGLGYLLDKLPGGQGRDYSQILGEINRNQDAAFNQNPGSYRVGEGAGIAAGLAGGAINAGVRGAATVAPTLGRMAMDGLKFGAGLGAISGFGSGRDLPSRLIGAGTGSVAGGVVGAGAPYAISAISAAASPFIAPLMARLNPEKYANSYLGKQLARSGKSPDDIADMLTRAQADDQGMFTAADAMGHSGQRGLSTVVRNPNEARQQIVDALIGRQMGQGDLLSNALAEGFNAPDTAAQRVASLAGQRESLANINYTNARRGAKPVNLNGALSTIDDLLGRDPILGETALSRGPMGTRLRALRDQMQKGGEQLVDFDRVLNLKSDMFQQMQRNPDVASELRPVYNALDSALERASPQYRAANDAYRAQSRTIDAVDAGKRAASGRARATDTIQTFQGMQPGERNAFRAGYVDPLIAKVEASAIAPTTNKARPLVTEKTGQEFPAFAVPQRADKMGRRIAREQRMFETANAALGGSKTADNLADAAEAAQFDPSLLVKFATSPLKASGEAVLKALKAGQGLPPSVLSKVGEGLMTTDPAVARALLAPAASQTGREALRRTIIQLLLTDAGASGTPRLTAQ
jgi:hypothetical protein